NLQNAMLFELSAAVGEQLLLGNRINWTAAIDVAVNRQRQHFDAHIPEAISGEDKEVAGLVGHNLCAIVREISGRARVRIAPDIPGLQWIASGVGDFAFDSTLIEVKCTGKRFGASDYRQILM